MRASLLVLLAQGCIVYQEKRTLVCDDCATDTGWFSLEDTGGDPVEPPPKTTTPETTPPEPEPDAFTLVPATGCPGELVLAELVGEGAIGVSFGRGVTVRDALPSEGALGLLLEVEASAAPGEVPVTVSTEAGEVRLASPFEIATGC